MDSDTYDKHWAVFEAAARPLLQSARASVQACGITCETVDVVDRDVDRGLGFIAQLQATPAQGDNNVFVELMLVDGDEAGFGPGADDEPQVNVSLLISDASGKEYKAVIPYNFTAEVGTADPVEIVARVQACVEPLELASHVINAWEQAFRHEAVQENSRQMAMDQARFDMTYARVCSKGGPKTDHVDSERNTSGNAVFFNPDDQSLTMVLGNAMHRLLEQNTVPLHADRSAFVFESKDQEKTFWSEILESLDFLDDRFESGGLEDCFPALAWSNTASGDEIVLMFDAHRENIHEPQINKLGALWSTQSRGNRSQPFADLLDPKCGIAHLKSLMVFLPPEIIKTLAEKLPIASWNWANVVHPEQAQRVAAERTGQGRAHAADNDLEP